MSQISNLRIRLLEIAVELSRLESRRDGLGYGDPKFSGLRVQNWRARRARLVEEQERIEKEIEEALGVKRWKEEQLELEFMKGAR